MNEPLVSQIYNAEPSLGNPSVDGYILSSTIAGVRSWIVPSSGGGVIPTDGILHWNSSTNVYEPYTTQQSIGGKFDTSVTNPVHTIRLNYDGNLYVTQLRANNSTTYAVMGTSTGTYAGLYGYGTTTGQGLVAHSVNGTGGIISSATGVSLMADNFVGNTSNIFECQLNGISKFTIDKDGLPKSVALAGTGDRTLGVDSTGLFKVIPSSTYTFTSGLTESAGTVKLGGTITEQVTIDGNGTESLYIGGLSSVYNFSVNAANIIGLQTDCGFLLFSTTNTTYTDTLATPLGIQYDADYSATFTSRSLVDKGYVDSHGGTVTSISTTSPITGGIITTTGTIGITQATTNTNGYLSSTDWNTFNNKISSKWTTSGYDIYRASGSVGIGINIPTARLHLPTSTGSAWSAPLKFSTGSLLSYPESGAMEWNGSTLYMTVAGTFIRKALAYAGESSLNVQTSNEDYVEYFIGGEYRTMLYFTITESGNYLVSFGGALAVPAACYYLFKIGHGEEIEHNSRAVVIEGQSSFSMSYYVTLQEGESLRLLGDRDHAHGAYGIYFYGVYLTAMKVQ